MSVYHVVIIIRRIRDTRSEHVPSCGFRATARVDLVMAMDTL